KMKELQKKGFLIALHGYQHRYVTENSGIMRINEYSEFAIPSFS
ncbi:MAG: DUF2334 domain-containing protein, partial [Bacteroidetes bacterium]|nr:DUF2334 domain-containing protein [Bacteroidota bacterium]